MNITSILKLATAFVALSISAHAAEVFTVSTNTTTYPVAEAANFNAVDADGNFTNPYNTFGNDPDIGNASGMAVTANFNGDSSAVNTGDQGIVYNNSVDPPVITQRTTYFGPKYYAGVNREAWQTQGTVSHSNGNGYRVRSNSVNASVIASNGGPVNTKVIYLFDADTSSLSGADDYLIFNDTDTLTATLSVPGTLGPNWTGTGTVSRASLATYRAVVKAKGPNDATAQYYAGTLYTVDLAALPDSSSTFNTSETGAAATWTLIPNIEVDSGTAIGQTNLTVDTSESATTVSGKFLTHITQVGFLLETDTNENTGGYNFGVRSFTANASSPNDAHPSGIEWSEDFDDTTPINFLTYYASKVYDPAPVFDVDGNLTTDADGDPVNVLTGFGHAYKWASNGDGLTATPASTITQENDQIVLDVKSTGPGGEVNIRMVGPGTDNARRVRPPSHEVTFEIDLIEWKDGQADLLLQTRGHDGYVRSVLSAGGNVKYTTWGSALNNYEHTNFDDINSPSSLTGVVIADGGTVDPAAAGVVEVAISGNAVGTVVLNGDAVGSVTLSGDLTGYTDLPTLTWTGMSVEPTVSFNFSNSVSNTARNNVVTTSLRDMDGNGVHGDPGDLPGNLLNDGQILTYIQSYDNSDDSLSYYYSLTNKTTGVTTGPTFITKLTAADHSPNGNGFFSISTGNKWGQPNNQDAVWIQYKKWGSTETTPGSGVLRTSKLGINSITVATTDDDRDGVINRNDAFANNPLESVDTDLDGVGDNSDQHPGYNDSVISAGITQAVWDASQTALTTAQSDLTTAQADLTTAQSDLTTAQADLTTAQAALANSLTLSQVQDLRAGSTMIAVSEGSATVSLQMEESSDLSLWSDLGDAVPFNVTLDPSDATKFYRVKLAD